MVICFPIIQAKVIVTMNCRTNTSCTIPCRPRPLSSSVRWTTCHRNGTGCAIIYARNSNTVMFTMPGFVGGEYADIIIKNVTVHNHRIYYCHAFTDIGDMTNTMILNVTGEL